MLYTDQVRSIFAASPNPCLILLPEADNFIIAGLNEAYLESVGVKRDQMAGKDFMEWLTENEAGFTANSLVNLAASLRYVRDEKKGHQVDLQKYSASPAEPAGFGLQYLATINTPVFGDKGEISFVLHTSQDITGLVAMRHRLEANEQQYHSLFAENPDAVFLLDTKGFFTIANRAALQLMECGDEQLLRSHFTDFCLPEDVPRMQDIFRESVSGKASSLVISALNPQGKQLELSLTLMPLMVDGLARGVYGVAKDITEKARAQREQDLLAGLSDAFTSIESLSDCLSSVLRLLCAHTGSAIAEAWISNIDNRELNLFSRISLKGEVKADTLAYWISPEGVIGRTWAQKKTTVIDSYQESAGCRRKQFAADNNIGTATGIPVIFNEQVIAVFVFFDRAGEPAKPFPAFSAAVLGQLAALIQRKKSEAEFSQYFNLSPDMLSIIGYDGYFKKVNNTFIRVLGFSEDELLARPYVDFVHPDDKEETSRQSLEGIRDNPTYIFENRYIAQDGRTVWMSWTVRLSDPERLVYAVARDVTEKKNLERTIETEQLRFARMFDEAPVSMCILKGKDHVFERANSNYYKYVGKKDIIGKSIAEVFPEAKEQQVPDWLDHVFRTGETFSSFETPISIDVEGTGEMHLFYLSFMFQAYRNNAGEIEGIFYFGVDVTEEVLARKKVVESERQHVDLIQNLPVAVYTTNAAGIITLYNKAAGSLWGFHPELGKKQQVEALQILNADFTPIPPGESPMAVTLKTGVPVRGREIVLKRRDGGIRHVMPHPSPIVDSNGKMLGGMNVVIDITEKKQAEAELLKLSLIAKKTNNAVIMTDPEGRIEWVNEAFCRITEYTAEEVIGKTTSFLHGEGTNRSVTSFMTEKSKRKQPFECEILKYTKSGRPFWVEVKRQPLFDTEGNLTRFFDIESDITERKEAFEKVLKSESEIRRFARQQNTIMEEERARIAREIHDEFGQQLTGLKMSLASLKKQLTTNPGNAEEVLAAVISDVDQSIQGLREFATELRPGILDTLGLFPSIGWLVKDFEKKNGIVASASFKVKEDMRLNDNLAICFFRICQEALTNVAKHSGGTHVHVEMEQIGGDMLSMKITDNGRGIVSDTINNPFSMGLLGMRERASLVGGELFISSYPGTKTTVHFLVNIHNE